MLASQNLLEYNVFLAVRAALFRARGVRVGHIGSDNVYSDALGGESG
jgi:hypothetical protein